MRKKDISILLVLSLIVAASSFAISASAMVSESSYPLTKEQLKKKYIPELGAEELPLVRASHQPCLHALPTWMGMQLGWPKDHGISIKYVYFVSGMPQVEAGVAGEWDVGAIGTVPMLMAAIRYGAYMVGISNDESETNDMWVRPDSPILKVKGWNPRYPEIYGSPDLVKGKTILCSTISTGHYAVVATLEALGLTEKDVNIIHMEQSAILAAFEAGKGDIAQLWAPLDYIGEMKGWVKMSSGRRAGVVIPGAIIVWRSFAEEHPDLTLRWLEMYFRGIKFEKLHKPAYMLSRYFIEYCGLEQLTTPICVKEFELRPLFDLEEQIKLFENGTVDKWMSEIANFFIREGRITEEEKKKAWESGFINVKFLKALADKKKEASDAIEKAIKAVDDAEKSGVAGSIILSLRSLIEDAKKLWEEGCYFKALDYANGIIKAAGEAPKGVAVKTIEIMKTTEVIKTAEVFPLTWAIATVTVTTVVVASIVYLIAKKRFAMPKKK